MNTFFRCSWYGLLLCRCRLEKDHCKELRGQILGEMERFCSLIMAICTILKLIAFAQ